MADDYIKQLQLSKQIEQKAKEAAKNRQQAESKLAEAEELLAELRNINAPTAEMEKLLTEASSSFKDKDYKKSLSQAIKSTEAAHKARGAKVEEVLRGTEELLGLVQKRNVQTAPIQKSIAQARSDLDEGRTKEAFAAAKEAWDKAEQTANRTVAEAFSEAQARILLLEGFGLKADAERASLDQARKNMEASAYKQSLEDIESCLESSSTGLEEHFRQREDNLRSMRDYVINHSIDLSKANQYLDSAVGRMESHDYQDAFAELKIAEGEMSKALNKGMTNLLTSMRKRTTAIKDSGGETAAIQDKMTAVKDLLKAENYSQAYSDLVDLERQITDTERHTLAYYLSKLRTRLHIAKKVQADISPTMEKADLAKSSLEKGDLKGALQQAEAASKELDRTLTGYQEIGTELEEYQQLLVRAQSLKLKTDKAEKTAILARRASLQKDFPGSVSLLRDSKKELQSLIQAHYGRAVIMMEMNLANALRMGAEVDDESDALDTLVNKIKRNEFGIVELELHKLSEQVDRRVQESSLAGMEKSRNIIDNYRGPMDLSEARNLLQKASEAYDAKSYPAAYDLSQQATEALKKEEILQLDQRMAEAGRMLTIMRELECESITLKDKYNKARDLRNARMFVEANTAVNEVIQFSSSIIKEEVSRQMTGAGRIISNTRRKKIDVGVPEHILEEGWLALKSNRIEEAYRHMQHALEELKLIQSQHEEVRSLLEEIVLMRKEAESHNLDISHVVPKLESAQQSFQKDKYREARAEGAEAHQEAERIVAPFFAPKRLANVAELLTIAHHMKLNVGKQEELLNRAQDQISKKEPVKALGMIREAESQITTIVRDGLVRDIATCKITIQRTREAGNDTTAAEMMLSKTEGLLADSEIQDAWRSMELTRSDLDQSVFMEQKAKDYMVEAKRQIEAVQDLGFKPEGAGEMLNQALNFQRQGNHALALELAKKAYQIACDSAENDIQGRIDAMLPGGDLDAVGPDAASVKRRHESIKSLINQRNYKEALYLLAPFQEELEQLNHGRTQAEKELAELEEKAGKAERAGILSEHVHQLIIRSKEKIHAGSFTEARAMMSRAAGELTSVVDMYENRHRELQGLKEDFSYLGEQKHQEGIQSMLSSGEQALQALDFERASLFLRRARAAILEATGAEVGRLFEELISLNKWLEREGIDRTPAELAEGNGTKMYDIKPKDLVKLRDEVENVKKDIATAFQNKLRDASGSIGKAKAEGTDVGTSLELLAKAETLASMDKVDGALDAVEDSKRYIGLPLSAYQQFQVERDGLRTQLNIARETGLDIVLEEDELAVAADVLVRDPSRAIAAVRELRFRLDKRLGELLPDVGVDLDFLDEPEKGRWGRLIVHIVNHGSVAAKDVELQLNGALEVKGLKHLGLVESGMERKMGIEIMPKDAGPMVVSLVVQSRSALTDQDCSYESEFEMAVK